MCRDDEAPGALAPGAIWEGPYRGGCLLTTVTDVDLLRPDSEGGRLKCNPYVSSDGTGYSEFFIILIEGECCIRSSRNYHRTDCKFTYPK